VDKARGKKWPERRRDHQTGHRQGERKGLRDAKLRDEPAGITGEGDEGLHPALVYLFVAIRCRPVTCILCWENNRLLFQYVRAGSLIAA
jgi:hypothetical protein